MQSKDILKTPDVRWAVVPQGKRSTEKRLEDISPSRVIFVHLYDTHLYHTGYGVGADISRFQRVFGGTKDVGYLVLEKRPNPTGGETNHYRVIRARDFIAKADDYESVWVVEQARLDAEAEANRIEQEKRDAEANRRRLIQENKLGVAREQADNTAETIKKNLVVLLGNAIAETALVSVRVDGQWQTYDDGATEQDYIISQSGSVSLGIREFQRLLNKITESK
jgi:hypothetical protein